MTDVELRPEAPSAEEHTRLRAAAGLGPYPPGVAPAGLAASWFAVTARVAGGEAVGMGRLVGDGALFLLVVDMAVHPDHQRRGVGARILRRLLEHAGEHAPRADVSLVADPPGQHLYRRYGFHDVAPALGMRFRR